MHIFVQKIILQLYHALVSPLRLYGLVSPLRLYGIIIREANYLYYLKKLKTLENRAKEIFVGCHYRDDANLFSNQFEILEIEDLWKFEIARFVHSTIYNRNPK